MTRLAPRARVVLLALAALCGCDREYVIEGHVVVARGAGGDVAPSVLCVGKGGPLDSSAVWGHPAARSDTSSAATIFCGPAPRDMAFPLREEITMGHLPRLARVYAWLEPVGAAKKLCADAAKATIDIDTDRLDQLMEPDDARRPPGERAPVSYPCGRNPRPGMHMTYAVTFDPDHETWTKSSSGAAWTEKRDLRLE